MEVQTLLDTTNLSSCNSISSSNRCSNFENQIGAVSSRFWSRSSEFCSLVPLKLTPSVKFKDVLDILALDINFVAGLGLSVDN